MNGLNELMYLNLKIKDAIDKEMKYIVARYAGKNDAKEHLNVDQSLLACYIK